MLAKICVKMLATILAITNPKLLANKLANTHGKHIGENFGDYLDDKNDENVSENICEIIGAENVKMFAKFGVKLLANKKNCNLCDNLGQQNYEK